MPLPQLLASSTFAASPPAQGTAPCAPSSSIHLSLALSQGASLPTATPSALCQRPRGPGRGRGRQPGPQGRREGPQLRGLLRLMWALVPLFVRCLVFYMVNGSDLPIKDFRCSAGPRKGCRHSSSLWLVGVRGRDLVSVGGWACDTRALPSCARSARAAPLPGALFHHGSHLPLSLRLIPPSPLPPRLTFHTGSCASTMALQSDHCPLSCWPSPWSRSPSPLAA